MSASKLELKEMAYQAADHLIANLPMPIVHAAGWERDGLPLPIKRMKPDADGTTTQHYRPLEILQYVHEVLNGEMAARRMRDRKAKKEEQGDTA